MNDHHVQTLVAVALYEAGVEDTDAIEVGVTFAGLDRIAELNAEHREVDGPTDVLSFPIDGLDEQLPPGMPRELGDVVISPEYVQRQLDTGTTMAADGSLEGALERCVVHGVLHLCGFDHERGENHAQEMFGLEQLVLDRVRSAGGRT
jgi:probable rRNA maturation factor